MFDAGVGRAPDADLAKPTTCMYWSNGCTLRSRLRQLHVGQIPVEKQITVRCKLGLNSTSALASHVLTIYQGTNSHKLCKNLIND